MAQDARKFKYSSDYPQPLVGFRAEYTVSAPAGEEASIIKFRHNLPFTPLIIGKYSDYSDFRVSQDLSSYNISVAEGRTYLEVYSDEEYVMFFTVHLDRAALTKYVRVIGFVPPDYTGDLTTIQSNAKFRFNTDDNYVGVYKQGVYTPASSDVIISHDLGYAPQCRAWEKVHEHIARPALDWTGYVGRSVITNSNSINLGKAYYASEGKGYYHIYTLEA